MTRTYVCLGSTFTEVGDIIGWMASAETHRSHRRGSTLGYAIVLLGAALFVTGCFLPYEGFITPASRTASLYERLISGPSGGGSDLGAFLYLFGGVAIVAAVALVTLVRGEWRTGLPSFLMGAVAAWSLTWIGTLITIGTFTGVSLEVGFWLQALGIGVAIIGAILVAARRRGAHERGSPDMRSRAGT